MSVVMFHDHLHCMSVRMYKACIHLNNSVYSCLGAHTAPSRCIVILCLVLPTYVACYFMMMYVRCQNPLLRIFYQGGYCVSHVFSCCVFPSCRMNGMLSTGLHLVAMSALSSTLHQRWSLYSTVQPIKGSPCYTVQLKMAMLKWFNF